MQTHNFCAARLVFWLPTIQQNKRHILSTADVAYRLHHHMKCASCTHMSRKTATNSAKFGENLLTPCGFLVRSFSRRPPKQFFFYYKCNIFVLSWYNSERNIFARCTIFVLRFPFICRERAAGLRWFCVCCWLPVKYKVVQFYMDMMCLAAELAVALFPWL